MINMKLKAFNTVNEREITLESADGETVARFTSLATFYIVTGFKTVEAYNAHQDEQPTKFLERKRKH